MIDAGPGPNDETWTKCTLYLSNLQDLRKEDIIDVIRLTCRPSKVPKQKSISDKAQRQRNILEKHPYQLHTINELGAIYGSEAQWDKCANVMLRGWKRAPEITDPAVRFRFLMKLCEVSYYLKQFRQAYAVMRDVDRPDGGPELKSYLVLSCQVYAQAGDLQQSLKAFNQAIEGEDFELAVRIFALVQIDLKRAGAYESAKSTLENLVGDAYHHKSALSMLETFAEGSDKPKPRPPDEIPRYIIAAVVVLVLAFFVWILYVLEGWSLQSIAAPVTTTTMRPHHHHHHR